MPDTPKADEPNISEKEVSAGDRNADSPMLGESATPHFLTGKQTNIPVTSFEDMDNDGDMDIVVTQHDGGESYWIENSIGTDAHGVFSHSVFSRITPTAVAVGDLDGDGTQDMVIGHLSGAKVFLNNGTWSMQNVGIVLDEPRTIILEDVNQDGETDILIRDSQNLVLIQNTQGAFGALGMTWPNLGDTPIMNVGEIDRTNETLEILTLNANAGVLGIISHNGANWQALQAVQPIEARTVVIADLNRDGTNDIFVEDSDGNKVWLESDGQGELELRVELPETDLEKNLEAAAGGSTENNTPGDQPNEAPSVGTHNTIVHPTPTILPMSPPPPEPEDQGAVETEGTPNSSAAPAPMPMPAPMPAPTPAPMPMPAPMPAPMPMPMPMPPPPIILPAPPPPVEPSFDYHALPDLDFEVDPETTADYSASDNDMNIDLDWGEATELSDSWFWWWNSTDFWSNTDTVVNAIGSNHDDDIYGNTHANFLAGRSGDDILFGDAGDDTLVGGKGLDVMFGDDDDDLMAGQQGDDLLFGDGGDDTLYGGSGDDALFGNKGADTILGGRGDDWINGGSGDDAIHGGLGSDTMYGGSGSDTFHYISAQEGGDNISRFNAAEDVFEFEFGQRTLHVVDESYNGDLGIEGEGFVWETTGRDSGKLYYDADTSIAGDETLIAEVELTSDEEAISLDNISIL